MSWDRTGATSRVGIPSFTASISRGYAPSNDLVLTRSPQGPQNPGAPSQIAGRDGPDLQRPGAHLQRSDPERRRSPGARRGRRTSDAHPDRLSHLRLPTSRYDESPITDADPTDWRTGLGSPDPHVPSSLGTILHDESSRPLHVPLQELKEITDNFSDDRILGQGGFGVVYKGVLPNGKTVAVKKMVSSLMPNQQKQFESEVYHLMMLKHPNIVRFLGYCYETKNECLEYNGKYVFAEMSEKLLCFEYLPKGSLDKYLSDESSGLDWSTRYKIIEGICYGLCHLHEQMDKPIIHLDLKPTNILLDDSLIPKITDFGMSRLLGQQQTICTSSRIGTLGYMAPEFLRGGTITPMSDIFSLGVIIMEIVTGHRDYPFDVTKTSSDDFIELTLEKWRNVLQSSPDYGSPETDCEVIKRCLQVGLLCVNPDRTKRPPITKVISMLRGSESIDCDFSTVFQQMCI